MFGNLIETIGRTIPLTEADKQLCISCFEPLYPAKNVIVEEQGKIPQYLYFISSGFMRLFYYHENGDEVTTYLGCSGDFIASFLDLIHQKPASENVGCISDCQLLGISRQNLVTLIDRSENFKKFSLVIFEKVMADAQVRANELATLTAESRYKKMITDQPHILQNFPVQYIASFLGIKPQSLSRIRRQISF